MATTDFLEEEQEKFWKLHQQDEQTLFDKIDMFTAQCMALTLQSDFGRVRLDRFLTKNLMILTPAYFNQLEKFRI